MDGYHAEEIKRALLVAVEIYDAVPDKINAFGQNMLSIFH